MKGNSLKKIVLLIWCLLGVVCAWASPFYRGAQAPVATMTSTSVMRSSYRQNDMPTVNRVQGFRTSASYVTGGVTSSQTYGHLGSSRRGPKVGGMEPPVDPTGGCQCEWEWNSDLMCWVCTKCGSIMSLDDGLDGNFHEHCPCPISFDWKALLFLTAAAGVYMAKKTKKSRA